MRILVLMAPAMLCLGACASAGEGAAPVQAAPAAASAAAPTLRAVVAMAPIPNPPEPGRARQAAVSATDGLDPVARVARANAAARVQPSGRNYDGAAQTYPFGAGALYQVYTTPGRVTDIALEAGETLSGTGPVAAGDTTRWIIGDTRSGAGADLRVHILVKPTAPDLRTNLVINTDRRTYHVELRATASTYMALVAWRYPTAAPVADPTLFADPRATNYPNRMYRVVTP
jgi:type IV secretion system protein VirB9